MSTHHPRVWRHHPHTHDITNGHTTTLHHATSSSCSKIKKWVKCLNLCCVQTRFCLEYSIINLERSSLVSAKADRFLRGRSLQLVRINIEYKMGGSASRDAADRYKRMTDVDSDRQPVEMKSVSSRFSFGGAAHRRKGGGAHGHGHHNPVLDAANEKKYQSLNYDEVHSGTFYKEVVHSKHEKIAEIKRCVVSTFLVVFFFSPNFLPT